MRVNLNVPYEQKDEAKRRGARWDPARRTWYVIDHPNLEALQRWIGNGKVAGAGPKTAGPGPRSDRIARRKLRQLESKAAALRARLGVSHDRQRQQPASKAKPCFDESPYKPQDLPVCDCSSPPWEDCEHTEQVAPEIAAFIRSLAHAH